MLDSTSCNPLKGQRANRGATLSEAEFRRLYADRSMTQAQIGAMLGISGSAVAARARSRGLTMRGTSKPHLKAIQPHMEAGFRELWLGSVKSCEIAAHYGICGTVLTRTARWLGLPPRGKTWQHKGITLAEFRAAQAIKRMAASAAQTRAAYRAAELASQKLLRAPLED